jgi:biofilm PGA synthesis protein PgaD
MDQSGPWPKATELIIDRPEGQPPLHRAAFGLVTLVFWAVWIYLMMPAVTLLGWAFGISRFVDIMIAQGGASDVARLIGWYLLVIGLMTGSLISWALYNWVRFRGATRRGNATSALANAQVAAHMRVAEATLARWQETRLLEVDFDDEGRYTRIAAAAADARRANELV